MHRHGGYYDQQGVCRCEPPPVTVPGKGAEKTKSDKGNAAKVYEPPKTESVNDDATGLKLRQAVMTVKYLWSAAKREVDPEEAVDELRGFIEVDSAKELFSDDFDFGESNNKKKEKFSELKKMHGYVRKFMCGLLHEDVELESFCNADQLNDLINDLELALLVCPAEDNEGEADAAGEIIECERASDEKRAMKNIDKFRKETKESQDEHIDDQCGGNNVSLPFTVDNR